MTGRQMYLYAKTTHPYLSRRRLRTWPTWKALPVKYKGQWERLAKEDKSA